VLCVVRGVCCTWCVACVFVLCVVCCVFFVLCVVPRFKNFIDSLSGHPRQGFPNTVIYDAKRTRCDGGARPLPKFLVKFLVGIPPCVVKLSVGIPPMCGQVFGRHTLRVWSRFWSAYPSCVVKFLAGIRPMCGQVFGRHTPHVWSSFMSGDAKVQSGLTGWKVLCVVCWVLCVLCATHGPHTNPHTTYNPLI